jgi:hypothetical protein
MNRAKEIIGFVEEEELKIHILYPDDRMVPGSQIMSWAEDAFANGEIDHKPEDLFDAIAMLNDAGIITTTEGNK